MQPILDQLALLARSDPGGLRPHEREVVLTRDNASQIRAVVMLAFPFVVALVAQGVARGWLEAYFVSVAVIVLFNVLGWTVPWRRLPRWMESVPPVGSIVALWAMAATTGGFSNGYGILVVVPLAWIALYGDPLDLLAGLVVTASCVFAPLQTWFPGLPNQGDFTQRLAIYLICATSTISLRPLVVQLREQAHASRRATYSLRASQAALAHDLRTPLTSVCALATLAEQRLAAGDHEAVSEYVARIADLGWRAEATIRGVLELSRAGELLPRTDPIAPRELLQDAAARVDGVVLTLGDLPEEIIGHEPSILRLFTNLLENAALHARDTAPGAMAVVAVEGSTTVTGWQFTVADDGPGINPSERALVFEPWRRGADARDGGHGLGLAIVSAIVEQHGGTISVDHERSSGACFTFTLSRTPRVASSEEELVARMATGVPLA